MFRTFIALLLTAALPIPAGTAFASEPASGDASSNAVETRFQWTTVRQQKRAFDSPYAGPRSLNGSRESSQSTTATLFLGANLGSGTEFYFNPEFAQGVPLSQLQGLAGFTNGELARTSGPDPRIYRARAFVRKTWNLGGAMEAVESDDNQVATSYAAERLVLTAGNLSALDVFDAVDYSRDARKQFMNWSSLTYAAWDFPADSRGYTWGAAIEYITPDYQVRVGRFLMPMESNGLRLDTRQSRQHGDVFELELPFKLAGREGAVRLLGFQNKTMSGQFDAAIALARTAGGAPDLGAVRELRTKRGIGIGAQYELVRDIGGYVRAAWNDGRTETYAFTEVDQSFSAGILAKGGRWGRAKDTVGIAGYVNALKGPHRDYLAAGGSGFFLGDGRLNYGREKTIEIFYRANFLTRAFATLGFQRTTNPGYNRDRGPVNVASARLHITF